MKYRSGKDGDRPGSYQLATRAGKTTINAGEILKFEQYVTGYGEIGTAKVQGYISTDAFDMANSHITHSLINENAGNQIHMFWGKEKDPLSDTGFTFLMNGLSLAEGDEGSMIFDKDLDSGRPILMSEYKARHAPFEYSLLTKKGISPGEHYIDFYLTYYNGEKWVTSKERILFRIRNLLERYAKTISALAVVASLSGIVRFAIIPLVEALIAMF